MAIYEFKCPRHGRVDAAYPMGQAPPSIACDACGGTAPRAYSTVRTSFRSPRSTAISGAIEQAEKSAHQPEVVSRLPPKAGRPSSPLNPSWLGLPRP